MAGLGGLLLISPIVIGVVDREPGTDQPEVTSYLMPARSMEPLIMANEHVLAQVVDEYEPRRGDVIVFEDPAGWLGLDSDDGLLIKRVIGLPGDTVVCCDDAGRLSINGEPLDESGYIDLTAIECAGPMTGDCDWSSGPVSDDALFVMGDNRAASADSTLHLCRPTSEDCDPDRAFVPIDLVRAVVMR